MQSRMGGYTLSATYSAGPKHKKNFIIFILRSEKRNYTPKPEHEVFMTSGIAVWNIIITL